MTANVLDISHLTLSIEHKTILQDIDLTIGAGETAALIGESGSGKSTLAQCILGLQPQRSRLTPESRIDFWESLFPLKRCPDAPLAGMLDQHDFSGSDVLSQSLSSRRNTDP